jgi:pimeloyl-ACP methyl ester carboxylesterase
MRTFLFCLLISLFPATAHAVIAYQEMRPGIRASAEYLIGEHSKPAVLLLHGFLQTREFPTVVTLARGLQDAGYTVLMPTLSLNIPNRVQSLACEAVHKHSMEEDVAEIGHWIAWLKSHGHRGIVLVGHSFGSLQLLAYLNAQPDEAVKAYIGASLIEAQIGSGERPALIAQLENRVLLKKHALLTQTLSFCKQYTSTPEGLLSYVRWDQPRTLMALKQSPVSVQLIMGDSDQELGRNWIKTLKHVQTPTVVVKGANHFMDGQHEFDLLEHTLKFLGQIQQSSPR